MKTLYLFLFACILISSSTFAQQVTIAPFKNNANGALTLIHDDFGASWAKGIEGYVDTMCYNRNIPMCFAAITKECDKLDWKKANEMIAHKHQIINHSMSHKCGIKQPWCETAGSWDEHNFNVEIDSSTALIERNTRKHPAFFIFPFDLFTDSMITYLKAKNYLGARAGKQNMTHPINQLTPFRLNFKVRRPEDPISDLVSFANTAINEKTWAIQVLHGVEDDSWGKVGKDDYAKYLNFLVEKRKNNNLWIANLSDVVTYQYLKEKYNVLAEQDARGDVTKIMFTNNTSIVLPEEKLLGEQTLTLIIKQKNKSVKKVTQNNQALKFEVRNDEILIDVNPNNKDIIISY